MQMALFENGMVSKAIIHVPVDRIVISAFNPRRQRTNEQIERLAKRITANGFEITRAPWAYRAGDHYEVFAGGTRVAAARAAGMSEIPVVLHSGFTEEQLIRLAEEDNENDEYHAPVSLVDTWLHYKYLSDQGWTQQRIADAKGVDQAVVARYIVYAGFPTVVHDLFMKNSFLLNGYAKEIGQLLFFHNLAPWLERGALMAEIITSRIAKSGATGLTAKQFAADVAGLNAAIKKAEAGLSVLDESHGAMFLRQLADQKARTEAQVHGIYVRVLAMYEESKRRQEAHMRAAADAAEAERQQVSQLAEAEAKKAHIMRNLVLGNATECLIPSGTKLVLTDPPYGMDYQSNRRVVSAKAEKLENDDAGAIDLLAAVLTSAYGRMADDSTLLVWVGWRQECQFRQVITSAGFAIRNSIIWVKPNHGSGDLEGSYAPKHERIIHAVKGNPKMNKRHDDVLFGSVFLENDHPTKKPLDLLKTIIEAHTNVGDIVADPFMGSGSTIVAAHQAGRAFWGCEISDRWHAVASQAVYDII